MNKTERFRRVMDILSENNLSDCARSHIIFEKLTDDELSDLNKVKSVIDIINQYESRSEDLSRKYPENIMVCLRQSRGLNEYDTSEDDIIFEYSPDEAFSAICIWNGLLAGYDVTIKGWIKDIYGVTLSANE